MGKLIVYHIKTDDNKFQELMKWCELPIDQKWELIYKVSKDGYEAVKFHSKCDD